MAYFGGTVSARPWPRIDVRFLLLFVLSLAGIASSLYWVWQLAQHGAALPKAVVETVVSKRVQVLVANIDIPAGRRLASSMFRLDTRTVEGFEDAVLSSFDRLRGKYALVTIPQNSTVLTGSVGDTEPESDIIARIPAGYRAVAIPVNALTGVEGWARPGARVDIVWSTTRRGRLIATTLVENAQVLSAARSTEATIKEGSGPEAVPQHVSLLLTLKDAQKIQLAKNSGSLSLSLRGEQDSASNGSQTVSEDTLVTTTPASAGSIDGRVSFDGRDYVLQAGKLLPAEQSQSGEQQPEPAFWRVSSGNKLSGERRAR